MTDEHRWIDCRVRLKDGTTEGVVLIPPDTDGDVYVKWDGRSRGSYVPRDWLVRLPVEPVVVEPIPVEQRVGYVSPIVIQRIRDITGKGIDPAQALISIHNVAWEALVATGQAYDIVDEREAEVDVELEAMQDQSEETLELNFIAAREWFRDHPIKALPNTYARGGKNRKTYPTPSQIRTVQAFMIEMLIAAERREAALQIMKKRPRVEKTIRCLRCGAELPESKKCACSKCASCAELTRVSGVASLCDDHEPF